MDRGALERMLGEGLPLAEIGRRADRHEATVAYWLRRHGLAAAGRARHASKGRLTHGELAALVDAGRSIAQIAARVGRSKSTIRHWLRRYGMKTHGASDQRRVLETKRPKDAGLSEALMLCSAHGETSFVLDERGYYRCRRCRSASVSRRRRRLKQTLVLEAGGACRLCGYSRCLSALEFHHLEPENKAFALSEEGVTRSIARARAEARKCALLCANCHAEVESGIANVTDTNSARVECGSPEAHSGVARSGVAQLADALDC
jgi:DNA-binding CsgD family transcriptional regulator